MKSVYLNGTGFLPRLSYLPCAGIADTPYPPRCPGSTRRTRDSFRSPTVNRWIVKFGPLVAAHTCKQYYPRSMDWHVDETYIRVSGKWRIVDHKGQFVDFRLTAKRDSKAAKAFLKQARANCGLRPSVTIVTDKAPTYPGIIQAMDDHPYFNQPIKHVNLKWQNNRIESDHAALKRIVNPGKGFKTMRSAKSTLLAIEAFRTIKRDHVFQPPENPAAEIRLMKDMFGIIR